MKLKHPPRLSGQNCNLHCIDAECFFKQGKRFAIFIDLRRKAAYKDPKWYDSSPDLGASWTRLPFKGERF
jgi:hypothetical protein